MMKTVFFKSGAYYETPAVSVAGAVNDVFDLNISQFLKTDNSLKFDFIDGQYRLFLSNHIPGVTVSKKIIDPAVIAKIVKKYGFAYYGMVTMGETIVTHAEMFEQLRFIAYDRVKKRFIDALTGAHIPGDNVMPVMYCVKMTEDVAAVYLTSMAMIDSLLMDETGEHRVVNDCLTVCINDGDSIRSQFLDVRFTNVLKHFKNQDLITGYYVYAKCGAEISLNLFNSEAVTSKEFKNQFKIEVDTNFKWHVTATHQIVVSMPNNTCNGYLCVKLVTTPLYADISDREIKETLSFDFSVSVL